VGPPYRAPACGQVTVPATGQETGYLAPDGEGGKGKEEEVVEEVGEGKGRPAEEEK
jgi:hypothetical protein